MREDSYMIDPEEDELIYEYISLLRKQGINFPKEDPFNYEWTTDKLMKYIKEHTDPNIILPWEYPYPPRG
jgi:hypothetical protein